ncbi:S41 family peptidase [Aquimarina agarilytica]|uniref:S41 family peptidase n=1 Tax=Aquimarina agarilytica TaxID=1087449 RepID=UPI000287D7A9|nr:S41 family peptidase [Aquimarina agarilytica]
MKKITLLITMLCFTSCVSTKHFNTQIAKEHSVIELHNDIDKAYYELKKLHPKLYQYISKKDLDHKFDSLKQHINQPLKSHEFYKKIAPVIASIKQGHISVAPPFKKCTAKEKKQYKKTSFDFNKLDFEYVTNAFLISANYNKTGKEIVGSEVIRVNNEPIQQIIQQSKKRFASDGYNTTFHNRIIAHHFSGMYLKHKGVVMDSIRLQLKNKDSVYYKTFTRVLKEKYRKKDSTITPIKKVKLTQEQKLAHRKKQRFQKKYNKQHGFIKSKDLYQRNFSFIGKDSPIAYLKIRGFHTGNYKKFYENSFQKIEATKTKTLIIDLRDNTGGRLNEIYKLYSYLTDQEFQFVNKAKSRTRIPVFKAIATGGIPFSVKFFSYLISPILITHDLLKTSKREGNIEYKLSSSKVKSKPNPLNFKGNIYVLINGNSFSASSILATNLHATNSAVFVGEETGGGYNGTVAGLYKNVLLPNSKIRFNFGLMQIEAPYKNEKIGHGIVPDIKITPTKEDRTNNVDPELTWVLKHINAKKEVLYKTGIQ